MPSKAGELVKELWMKIGFGLPNCGVHGTPQLGGWGVTEFFFSSTRLSYGQPDWPKVQLDQLTKLRGVVSGPKTSITTTF
jgi:hypothetical protein